MKYPLIKDNSGTPTPYTASELKAEFPNVSFPKELGVYIRDGTTGNATLDGKIAAALADRDFYRPVETTPPTGDVVTEILPAYNGTEWEQAWDSRSYTQAELDESNFEQDQQAALTAVKNDAQVKALMTATPTQIDNYIDNNVTDLASAKDVLKIYGRALRIVAGAIYRP